MKTDHRFRLKSLDLWVWVFVLVILVYQSRSNAYLRSDVDFGFGPVTLDLKTKTLNKKLSSPLAIEMNYNLVHDAMDTAYCFSIFEMTKSDEGVMNFSRFAVGMKYYPMGLNGRRLILDNDTEAVIWKASPYVGFFIGLSNTSVTEFNASTLDMTPRFGVEIPLTASMIMQAQFETFSSLTQGTSSIADSDFSYSGFAAMIGFRIISEK